MMNNNHNNNNNNEITADTADTQLRTRDVNHPSRDTMRDLESLENLLASAREVAKALSTAIAKVETRIFDQSIDSTPLLRRSTIFDTRSTSIGDGDDQIGIPSTSGQHVPLGTNQPTTAATAATTVATSTTSAGGTITTTLYDFPSIGLQFHLAFGTWSPKDPTKESNFKAKELVFSGTEKNPFGALMRVVTRWRKRVEVWGLNAHGAWVALRSNLSGQARDLAWDRATWKEGLDALFVAYGKPKDVEKHRRDLVYMKQEPEETAWAFLDRILQAVGPFRLEFSDELIVETILLEGLNRGWTAVNQITLFHLAAIRENHVHEAERILRGARDVPWRFDRSAEPGAPTKEKKPVVPCRYCGQPFVSGHRCLSSQKKTETKSNPPPSTTKEVKGTPNSGQPYKKKVHTIGSNGKDFVVLVTSDGIELVLEIDTGADDLIITGPLAQLLGTPIVEQDDNLQFLDGKQLHISGRTTVQIMWEGQLKDVQFLIAPDASSNVVSLRMLGQFLGDGATSIQYEKSGTKVTVAGVELVETGRHVFRNPTLQSNLLFGNNLADPEEFGKVQSPILAGSDLFLENAAEGLVLEGLTLTEDQHNRLRQIVSRMEVAAKSQTDIIDRKAFNFDGVNLIPEAPTKIIQSFRKMSAVHADAAWKMIRENQQLHRVRKATWDEAECVVNLCFPRKPNGDIRPCSDLVAVNAYTIPDPTPIPSVQDTLQSLDPDARVFAVLDLLWGFWQIPATERAQRRMCFYAPDGDIYTWTVMPFGARNAPAHFRTWMRHLMTKMPAGVIQYFDDVHIQGRNVDELLERLQAVVEVFVEEGVAVSPKKLQIGTQVRLLGWIRTPDGLKPDPAKVRAIMDLQPPKNLKQLRQVLGLFRFLAPSLPRLSQQLAPLNRLLRKNVAWTWTSEDDQALTDAKTSLTEALLLNAYDPTLPLCIRTDASEYGVGGYLFQRTDDGSEHVLWSFSKSFTGTSQRWSVVDKEAFAILYAFDTCSDFVAGQHVTLYTDHRPLLWLLRQLRQQTASARVYRWCVALMAYDFTLQHVPGTMNVVADALSRPPFVNVLTRRRAAASAETTPSTQQDWLSWDKLLQRAEQRPQAGMEEVTSPTPVVATEAPLPPKDKEEAEVQPIAMNVPTTDGDDLDTFARIALARLTNSPLSTDDQSELTQATRALVDRLLPNLSLVEGRLFYKNSLYIPEPQREDILFYAHQAPFSGHLGAEKTTERLRERAWWPGWTQDILSYTASCDVCARNKNQPTLTPDVKPLPVAGVFERVHLDLIGPFPETISGNNYALVGVDAGTKFIVLEPLPDKSAETVSAALVKCLFLPYGFPDTIVTDQGREFVNALNRSLCANLGITHRTTSPYHPASNGQVERLNGVVKTVLRCIEEPDQSNWDVMLPYVAFAINTSTSSGTRVSPFWLMYGREPRTLVDALCPRPSTQSSLDHHHWFRALRRARQLAALLDGEARNTFQDTVGVVDADNAAEIQAGDLVLINFKGRVQGKSRSLLPRQQGPYRVLSVRDGTTAMLQNVHIEADQLERHISLLKRYRASKFTPGMDFNWEVQSILESRKFKGKRQYLVTWKGYSKDLATWISETDLNAPELKKVFEKQKLDEKHHTKKVSISRIIQTEKRGRDRYHLVAIHDDTGPDDYVWIPEKDILNIEEFLNSSTGGDVSRSIL